MGPFTWGIGQLWERANELPPRLIAAQWLDPAGFPPGFDYVLTNAVREIPGARTTALISVPQAPNQDLPYGVAIDVPVTPDTRFPYNLDVEPP